MAVATPIVCYLTVDNDGSRRTATFATRRPNLVFSEGEYCGFVCHTHHPHTIMTTVVVVIMTTVVVLTTTLSTWGMWLAAWVTAWVDPQYGGLHRGCGRGCASHSAIRLQCCEQEVLVRTLPLPSRSLSDGPTFPKQSRPVGASETSPLLGVGVVIIVVSYWCFLLVSYQTPRHNTLATLSETTRNRT